MDNAGEVFAEREGGVWKVIQTNPLQLPTNSTLFREPPRPYSEMTPGYFSRYDGHTLAADIFNSGSQIVAIGPPLTNLLEQAQDARFQVDGATVRAPLPWQDLNRISRMLLADIAPADRCRLTIGQENLEANLGADLSEVLRDANAVITLNKDNSLANVRDWLINYTENHAIDTAIIYDNRSTTYTRTQLLDTMKNVVGLKNGIVVDWPYKYGNTGGRGPEQIWDSDFGQYMCWEHARWRFLRHANCVAISDVDEMPISSVGKTLVRHVEETSTGVFSYPVRDTPAVPREGMAPSRERLHTDYLYADSVRPPHSAKIVYRPSLLPKSAQVGNHQVIGVKSEHSDVVISRHFAGVHMSWRSGSFTYSDSERGVDLTKEFFDSALMDMFSKTFPERFDGED